MTRLQKEASDRAEDAWAQRYKHGKASRTWDAVAREQPQREAICKILAEYMAAYEAADAKAERAFRELAAREAMPASTTEDG